MQITKKWTHLDFLVELIYDYMEWTDMPDAPDDDEATCLGYYTIKGSSHGLE